MIARIKRWILRGFSYHSNIDTIDISPSTVDAIILNEKMTMLLMARNIFQNHAWFLFIIYIVVFKIRKKGLISSRTETCVVVQKKNNFVTFDFLLIEYAPLGVKRAPCRA